MLALADMRACIYNIYNPSERSQGEKSIVAAFDG